MLCASSFDHLPLTHSPLFNPSSTTASSIPANLVFSGYMEAMKGQGGIQLLLTAEQEAQQIVAAARNLKMMRLRQAKDEAEQEVALYRKHLEEEYQNSISETSGNSGSNVKRLEQETAMKIDKLNQTHSKVSSDVVNMLLKYVTSVPS